MSPTINSTPDGNGIVENFMDLYAENPQKVIESFQLALHDLEEKKRNGAVKVFLKLYESASARSHAMEILCNAKFPRDAIGILLSNDLMNEDKSLEIFMKLHKNEKKKAISTFTGMLTQFANTNRAIAIFLELHKNDENYAMQILCNGELSYHAIANLLANPLISENMAAEILRRLHMGNSGHVIEAFSYMIVNDELSNRATIVFLKLYKNDKHNAMQILHDRELEYPIIVNLLINSSMAKDMAAKILKELHIDHPEKAMKAFQSVFEDHIEMDPIKIKMREDFTGREVRASLTEIKKYGDSRRTKRNEVVRVFLKLYEVEDSKKYALEILSNLKHSQIEKILANDMTDEDTATKIFKGLYENDKKKAISTFSNMVKNNTFNNTTQNNTESLAATDRAVTIFLKLYGTDEDYALNFLCTGGLPYYTVGNLLTNYSMGEDSAMEILKKLLAMGSQNAIDAFNEMFSMEPSSNRATAMFLTLYEVEDDRDMALAILSGSKLTCLAHASINLDKSVEIFRKLYAKNPEGAISAFSHMASSGRELFDRVTAIFLTLYEVEDDRDMALAILPGSKLMCLAHASINLDKSIEIFRKLYAKNPEGAISAFRHMIDRNEFSKKVMAIFLTLYEVEDDRGMALAILSGSKLTWLANTLDIDKSIEIFRDLYENNQEEVIDVFGNMLTNSRFAIRKTEIFIKLCNSDDNGAMSLAILLKNKPDRFTIEEILRSTLVDINKIAKIFKKLYAVEPKTTIDVFNYMIATNAFRISIRAVEIFSALYGNDKDCAIKVLCDERLTSPVAIKTLLESFLISVDMGTEIFQEFFLKNSERAIEVLCEMAQYSAMKCAKFFAKVVKNCEEAAKILLREEITHEKAAFFLADTAISAEKMAEILTAIYYSNAADEMAKRHKMVHILMSMYCDRISKKKLAAALLQMNQSVVDLLLSMNPLGYYEGIVRAQMEKMRLLQANIGKFIECHEEEFIANFQHSTSDVETGKVENPSGIRISQEETSQTSNAEMDKVEEPSDGEILRGQNRFDGEGSLINPEMPTAEHPGWLEKIFTGTVGKVLVAVAVAVGSGLALWAVILWPLATCIGAGCAVVTLVTVAFFRNRNANERKALEMDSSVSDGVDLPKVANIQIIHA
jgi:hypothetical protein